MSPSAPASRPLRVHALIDGLGWGGAETLLADLAAGAPAAGIELSVGYFFERSATPAALRLAERGMEPVHVPVHALRPRALRRVRDHLAALRPDIVHTHLSYADLLGGLAARRLGIPAVSTVHVMEADPAPRERLKTALTSLVRRRAMSRVVAVSEAARLWILDAGWDRPERVVTVHNGVAAEPRPGAGAAVRAELGLAPDDLVITMLAVLRPGKGHAAAIEALELLRHTHPRARLLIAGDGPARGEIERHAERLGDAVVMAGHRTDVMELLDASDLLAHPSSADAFPTALLEALAAGVPVVATRVGGIPEIVDHGDTGLLLDAPCSPDDLARALGVLLGDAERRETIGRAARERFQERFTAERWALRLRSVYDNCLSAR